MQGKKIVLTSEQIDSAKQWYASGLNRKEVAIKIGTTEHAIRKFQMDILDQLTKNINSLILKRPII